MIAKTIVIVIEHNNHIFKFTSFAFQISISLAKRDAAWKWQIIWNYKMAFCTCVRMFQPNFELSKLSFKTIVLH